MEKIVAIGYGELTKTINRINYVFPDSVEFIPLNCRIHESVKKALELEREGNVDVFVSAGANARLLSKKVKTMLVEVKVTGLDILHALRKAGDISEEVGVLTYDEKIPGLDDIRDILTINFYQMIYDENTDVEVAVGRMFERNISTIVGSSLVIETVERMGGRGVLVYSPNSIRMALDSALQIALSKQLEKKRLKELDTILNFAHGGIIATDEKGIIRVFNPSAVRITNFNREMVIGKHLRKVFPGAKWNLSHRNQKPELNKLRYLGERRVSTNLVPIIVDGSYTGLVVTLEDIASIQAAEKTIRQDIYSRGFTTNVNFDDIVGNSNKMVALKDIANHYAKTDSTVLITGETGTGKEPFAKSIHSTSKRSTRPFVAINCAAFHENLLESELFGYEKGAFTGARKGGKLGLFELSDGGTVFLDEIAEMPLLLQTRLLRILEDRKVMPVGGVAFRAIDIRVVAATNKNLWDMVKENKFREDLYYRINVLNLHIPPLRERKEDIPDLVKCFLQEFYPSIPNKITNKLCKYHTEFKYDWPGNIRELRHSIERFSALYSARKNFSDVIRIISNIQKTKKPQINKNIEDALYETEGNKSKAAKKLGISRTTLWRILKENGNLSSGLALQRYLD